MKVILGKIHINTLDVYIVSLTEVIARISSESTSGSVLDIAIKAMPENTSSTIFQYSILSLPVVIARVSFELTSGYVLDMAIKAMSENTSNTICQYSIANYFNEVCDVMHTFREQSTDSI